MNRDRLQAGPGVRVVLNLVGVVLVGWSLAGGWPPGHIPLLVVVAGGGTLLAWTARQFVRSRTGLVVAAVAMVVLGSTVVVGTEAVLIAPVMVALVVLAADLTLPAWAGPVLGALSVVLVALAAVAAGASPTLLLGSVAGVALAVLIGHSRRLAGVAALREEELAQRMAAAEREQQRGALLADRARVAREVHDVLAHGLGGLVLQLDAVEALLEAGRVTEAGTRAADARRLAADSLVEARRAVSALREPQEAVVALAAEARGEDGAADRRPTVGADPSGTSQVASAEPSRSSGTPRAALEPETGLVPLVAAHRSFGGTVTVDGDLTLHDLEPAQRAVVVAATREALVNARKHAPGVPVALSVIRDRDAVDVVVANGLPRGGHGLLGMRERFAELGDGSAVEAERSDDEFVVAMHLPLPADDGPDDVTATGPDDATETGPDDATASGPDDVTATGPDDATASATGLRPVVVPDAATGPLGSTR